MAIYTVAYRLTVYASRRTDPTEATVLTPSAGAAHSDNFKLASIQGVTGFQPYLGLPRGRRGRIDPLTKRTDVGELSIPILDFRVGALTDNLTRWMTAFLGDAAGFARMMGLKVYVEESLDGGATWTSFFTGRIAGLSLDGKLQYEMRVQDMSVDMRLPLFVGRPHDSASNAQQPSLLPIGVVKSAWGTFAQTSGLTGTIAWTSSRKVDGVSYSRGLIQVKSSQVDRPDNLVTQELLSALTFDTVTRNSGRDGSHPVHVANFRGIARLRVATTGGSSGDFILGHVDTVYAPGGQATNLFHVAGLTIQELFRVKSMDANPPGYLAMPTTGSTVTFYVQVDQPVEGAHPVLINDTHPVQVWQDILNGYYGYLWKVPETLPSTVAYGEVKRAIAYSTSAFAALIADDTYPTTRFIIKEKDRLDSWVEKNILQPYQLGYYLDADGKVTPVDLRRPTTLPGLTIADADLAEKSQNLTWEHDLRSAVTRVLAHTYEDWPLGAALSQMGNAPRGQSGAPKMQALFSETRNTIELVDIGRIDAGDVEVTIDAKGFRGMTGETLNGQNRFAQLEGKLIEFIVNLQQPYGGGATLTRIRCRRTSNTTGCNPGDVRLLDIDALPDPATNLRGGIRLGRCVERAEDGPEILLSFLDLGLNLTADPPSLGVVTVSTGSTQHGVEISVTLNASTEPAQVDYAVTSSTVGTIPTTSHATWTMAKLQTFTGTASVEHLPAGQRVWMRARTLPGPNDALKLPSSWVPAASSGYADLSGITGPSALATSGLAAEKTFLAWTLGTTEYATQLRLASPSTGTMEIENTVAPGQTRYELLNLVANTCYQAGARHTDGIGGYSTEVTAIFSTPTTASSTNAPDLVGVYVIKGY